VVDNYGHGFASEKHVKSWKGLLTQAGSGASTFLSGITLSASGDGNNVDVVSNVPAGGDGVVAARLYYTATQVMGDDKDLRDAVWSMRDLLVENKPGSETYASDFATPMDHWAVYLEIEYYDKNGIIQLVSSPPLLSWEQD
jgi:hypothetical protein